MRATQKKLYEFLQQHEREKRHFNVVDMSNASGLSEGSIVTYLSKNLRGRWVFPIDDKHFEAKGITQATKEDFERAMTQKTTSTVAGFEDWKRQVESLAAKGVEEGYPVSDTLLELAALHDESGE